MAGPSLKFFMVQLDWGCARRRRTDSCASGALKDTLCFSHFCLLGLVLLSSCQSSRQAIDSSAHILKSVEDERVVEKTGASLLELQMAVSNANATVAILNTRLPTLIEDTDAVLIRLPDILDELPTIVTNAMLGLQIWNQVGEHIDSLSTNAQHLIAT